LDPYDRRSLFEAGHRGSCLTGGSVLADQPGSHDVIVLSGRVKLTRAKGNRTMVFAILGPGDLVGCRDSRLDNHLTFDAIAVEPCEYVRLARSDFDRLVLQRPGIALALVRTLISQLNRANDMQVQHLDCSVSRRLARLLLELATQRELGGAPVVSGLRQEEIADLVGASRDAVSRALTGMRRRGMVATGRRGITLLDKPSLYLTADLPSREVDPASSGMVVDLR
jgi:CRP-like cAMP-binding protein